MRICPIGWIPSAGMIFLGSHLQNGLSEPSEQARSQPFVHPFSRVSCRLRWTLQAALEDNY